MVYFSNQELAISYHVSARTVRNWIESAKNGKLNLSLHSKGERTYIANTSKNTELLELLSENGKKYRPHRSHKIVTPKAEFYELYTQEQIYDIVSSLEINKEIPYQYEYFGSGAENWDDYSERLAYEETLNSLKSTISLLKFNRIYIDSLISKYDQVNIVDIGVGNGYPVKDLLAYFIEKGKLGRYIAIDISPTMLSIVEKNIKKWFGDSISFEKHMLDIDHDRFGHLLAEEYIKTDAEGTTNLIMLLGGTLSNFRKPEAVLNVIHDSMGINDYLVHSQKLDTKSTRRYFDFKPAAPTTSNLAPLDNLVINMINIDESDYDVDMGFDDKIRERYIRVILKIAITVRFKFKGGERNIHFNKGDSILIWRAHQFNVLDVVGQLMESDMYPLQVSQTHTQEYVLTVSRIKRD